MYMRFAEALPVARIAVLWLGTEPSPALVCQVLAIIDISFSTSSSFGKKFELASGWLVLKKLLPPIWDDAIHEGALDLLLQPPRDGGSTSYTVKCPQILAVVLLALRQGLSVFSDPQVQGLSISSFTSGCGHHVDLGPSRPVVERILDALIDLHNSQLAFRHLFRAQSSTDILIDCLSALPVDNTKISTQLIHFGLLIANDNHVLPAQKQQVFGGAM